MSVSSAERKPAKEKKEKKTEDREENCHRCASGQVYVTKIE